MTTSNPNPFAAGAVPDSDLEAMRDAITLVLYARAGDSVSVGKMLTLMSPEMRSYLVGALIGLSVNLTRALDALKPGSADYALRNAADLLAKASPSN